MECSKQAIIMRGVPGAGKSSWARRYCDLQLASYAARQRYFGICSADRYFYSAQGHYRFNANLLTSNHRRNQFRFQRLLARGWPLVICDNTNLYNWMMLPYIEAARRHGYQVQVVEIARAASLKTVRQFAARNRHQVALAQVLRMAKEFEPATVALRNLVDNYRELSGDHYLSD